jgi:PhnB protein
MSMEVQPYLFFEGRCREALVFYTKTLGAEVLRSMKFSESPDPQTCAGVPGDSIMHATFKIGKSTLMASDGRSSGKANFDGFSLSVTPATDAEAHRMFDELSAGGKVQMPLQKTFFASTFGMCADKFGVSWMVFVENKTK